MSEQKSDGPRIRTSVRVSPVRDPSQRNTTLSDVVSGSYETTCGVPWGVCDACPGVGLETAAGRVWCPQCAKDFPRDRLTEPCPLPASVQLTDVDGVSARVCFSHADNARVQLWTRRQLSLHLVGVQ
jgi:hypothetical protein